MFAQPLAAQIQGGNVWLIAGNWAYDFREEAESWPNGKHAAGATTFPVSFHNKKHYDGSERKRVLGVRTQ